MAIVRGRKELGRVNLEGTQSYVGEARVLPYPPKYTSPWLEHNLFLKYIQAGTSRTLRQILT